MMNEPKYTQAQMNRIASAFAALPDSAEVNPPFPKEPTPEDITRWLRELATIQRERYVEHGIVKG